MNWTKIENIDDALLFVIDHFSKEVYDFFRANENDDIFYAIVTLVENAKANRASDALDDIENQVIKDRDGDSDDTRDSERLAIWVNNTK
jgi:hypothetical protein